MDDKRNGKGHPQLLDNNGHLDYYPQSERTLINPDSCLLDKKMEVCESNKNFTHKKCHGREILRCMVLVISTFVAHVLSSGMSYSLGVYHVEFLSAFQEGNGITSLVGSLNFGALCAAGPLSGLMVHRIGCPNTIIIGGLISSLGIFMCYFAGNIYCVLATFGLMTGVGYGLVFASCLTLTTCHITHWRAVCNGVSLAGIGVGIVIIPLLTEYLVSTYTWRGAILITSAITMNVCVCGFIARIAPEEGNQQISVDIDENPSNELFITDNESKGTPSGELQHDHKNIETNSLWTNPLYWCLHINVILFCFGQSIVFTHVAPFALSKGLTQMQASSLISVIGVSNTFGRILFGIIASIPHISVKILHPVLILICALFTSCYTFWTQYLVMASFLGLLGIALSDYGPVLCEVTVVIVGIQDFARGYGFLLLSMAFGTLLGAPSAGNLYDHTEVYENSFYLGAASFTLSACIFAGSAFFHRIFCTSKKNPVL